MQISAAQPKRVGRTWECYCSLVCTGKKLGRRGRNWLLLWFLKIFYTLIRIKRFCLLLPVKEFHPWRLTYLNHKVEAKPINTPINELKLIFPCWMQFTIILNHLITSLGAMLPLQWLPQKTLSSLSGSSFLQSLHQLQKYNCFSSREAAGESWV